MLARGIKFVYNEPAMIVTSEKQRYLVIGDLHIGMERKFSERGVHLYNASDTMARRIKKIMESFSLKNMILLGDIKNSILYPDAVETRLLRSFFNELSGFDIQVVAGNHDAHLGETINLEVKRELLLNEFAFLHGDKRPRYDAMLADYIITAHNHASVRHRDKNGAVYEQKVWLFSNLNKKMAGSFYKSFNKKATLIIMPAFNDLIMGSELKRNYTGISPLLRAGIFRFRGSRILNLQGVIVKLPL